MVHDVKSWLKQFEAVSTGKKTAELRVNDRGYKVGDLMRLHEYNSEKSICTGRTCLVEITHMLDRVNICAVSKAALHDDYAILSVKLV